MTIGKIVSGLTSSILGAQGLGDVLEAGAGGGGGGGFADLFEGGAGGGLVGSVLSEFVGAATSLFEGGPGGLVDQVFDTLGLPDWLGDIAGGVVDGLTGNWGGMVEQGLELLGGLTGGDSSVDLSEYREVGDQVRGMYSGERATGASEADAAAVAGATRGSMSSARATARAFERGDMAGAARSAVRLISHEAGMIDAGPIDVAAALRPVEAAFSMVVGGAPAAEMASAHGSRLADFASRLSPAGDQDTSMTAWFEGLGEALLGVLGEAGVADGLEGVISRSAAILGLCDGASAPLFAELGQIFELGEEVGQSSRLSGELGASLRL